MTTPTKFGMVSGIFIPLITPFCDGGELDEESLRHLVRHFSYQPIDGLILGTSTGEDATLDDCELERMSAICVSELMSMRRSLPVYVGLSGSDTRKLAQALKRSAGWLIDGYSIRCPSDLRPSQDGLLDHFAKLSGIASRPIMLCNARIETGCGLRNETLLRLAECENIIGVIDYSSDIEETFELTQKRPADFSVLTGVDTRYYGALSMGADGGVLASAHVETKKFAAIRDRLLADDRASELAEWHRLCEVPRLLCADPNPAAIKYWLYRVGLIGSPTVRLPMTPVSERLADRIEHAIAKLSPRGY